MKGSKYFRSVDRHVSCGRGENRHIGRPAFCQKKADKLARLGTPHIVEILYDDLTQVEADELEKILIKRLGRRDIGTGILCNLSDGGENSNWNSPITRENHLKAVRSERNRNRVSKWVNERLKDPEILQKHIDTLNKHRKCKKITYDGINYDSLSDLSKALGIKEASICARLRKGQDPGKDYSGYNKKSIEYAGVTYSSMTELAKVYNMPFAMMECRLRSNIPLDAPHHTKKVTWDGIEYKSVKAIADKLGWSLNAVKARVKDGIFTYSELTPRNVKRK